MRIQRLIGTILIVSMSCGVLFAQSSECLNSIGDINYQYIGSSFTDEGTNMADLLIRDQEDLPYKRGWIEQFCDTMLGTRLDDRELPTCIDYQNFRYDPRQSLFMYTMCVNFDEKSNAAGKISGAPSDYEYAYKKYKDEVFQSITYGGDGVEITPVINPELDLNEIWGLPPAGDESLFGKDACDPVSTMDGCNFSSFLPRIFNEVMNTYANMKLASIYGYKYVKSDASPQEQQEQRRKAIEEFSNSYFGEYPTVEGDILSECGDEGSWYLDDGDKEGENANACVHPQTYKLLDETIKSAKKLLDNVELLDAELVLEQTCADDYKDNMMSCAFSNNGFQFTDSDRTAFQNLLMNELMYYSLFVTYYTQELVDNIQFNELRQANYTANANRNQREAELMIREVALAQEALYQTTRMLSNVYTTFPVHIALMAYLEDIVKYRGNLTRLYTPFHQLYYLRRNAQECQE